ncbi:hypothetical protein Clacol_003838 [Clathrus columnatus]|uniref:Phosphatidylglycerol/phosphatidylinositol transfer protein n=1 Tax=Clathrus columnatus TaxID=1419009 RepID=A0AAV5A5Q2_9AGAM|nr:hypothetical protein Clacol_003838 [Clathrus columnatus]
MIRFTAICLSIFYLALFTVASPTTNNDQLILSSSPSSSLSDKWSWSDCGQFDDAVLVNSIKISPDPPKPGENLTVTASGIVYSEITKGTKVTVQVKVGSIKLLTKELDVCDEASNANAEIQCPVEEGDYTVTQSVALPAEIPPAKFTVHVEGKTAKNEPLLCLDLNIDFRSSFTKIFGFGLLTLMSLFVNVHSSPMTNETSTVAIQQHDINWSWYSCNNPGDPTHIDRLIISPDPPQAGDTELVSLSGFGGETLNDGAWAQLTVSVDGYQLPEPIDFDICSKFNNVHCPINKGFFDISGDLKIPSGLKGAFNAKVDVYNADNSHMACVTVTADF